MGQLPNRTVWENVDRNSNSSFGGSIFQGLTAAPCQTKGQREKIAGSADAGRTPTAVRYSESYLNSVEVVKASHLFRQISHSLEC